MLKVLGTVLGDLQLAPPDSVIRYYITLSRGDTISIRAFLSPDRFFQIKVSEFIDLRDEYGACVRAWKLHRELVPRPLGYRLLQGWAVLVTEGVHHQPFSLATALKAKVKATSVLDGLDQYFEICGQEQSVMEHVESHSASFDRIQSHFEQTAYAGLVSRWVTHGRSMGAESMAHVAQHGDFVQNNLASAMGRLIIFDWEDFGKSHLPGLDICSLCFSVAPDVHAMQNLMIAGKGTMQPLTVFASRACALSGLDWEHFRRLIPLYLVVFLYSKREYDQTVQDRVAVMVQQLTQ